jgi:hypothetical protein
MAAGARIAAMVPPMGLALGSGAATRARVTAALSLVGLLAACGGASDGRLCADVGTCGKGKHCVVGRCRAADSPPSPPDTTRVVLWPREVAVIASKGESARALDSFSLGREGAGTVMVLLRFEAGWRDDAEVTSAFVVLDPVDGAPPTRVPTSVDVARILEPWTPDTVSWGRQPRLGLFERGAELRPRGSVPVRIDVTKLVRAWSAHDRDDHGIAVSADERDPFGSTYALGPSGGAGPRLEAYVR